MVLYPSAVEAKLGTRLRDLDRPVLVLHSRMLDEMGMAAVGGGSVDAARPCPWSKPMHPLSAALSGTQTINKAAAAIGYGTPTSAADVISQVAGSGATEFAYDDGDAMAVGTAPACRVFFSGNNADQAEHHRVDHVQPGGGVHLDGLRQEHAVDGGRQRRARRTAATAASRSPAGFNTPWGVAIDSQDRVYVADSGAARGAPDQHRRHGDHRSPAPAPRASPATAARRPRRG